MCVGTGESHDDITQYRSVTVYTGRHTTCGVDGAQREQRRNTVHHRNPAYKILYPVAFITHDHAVAVVGVGSTGPRCSRGSFDLCTRGPCTPSASKSTTSNGCYSTHNGAEWKGHGRHRRQQRNRPSDCLVCRFQGRMRPHR